MGCKDFRPIGLCNMVYRLITKVIANRIKPVLDGLIHPSQTSFVPGRNSQENVVIAKEMAFFFKKKVLPQGISWLLKLISPKLMTAWNGGSLETPYMVLVSLTH